MTNSSSTNQPPVQANRKVSKSASQPAMSSVNPRSDSRHVTSQNVMDNQDEIPPVYNKDRQRHGRDTAQSNNMSIDRSFSNKTFFGHDANRQEKGRGRKISQNYQHLRGTFQHNSSRRARFFPETGGSCGSSVDMNKSFVGQLSYQDADDSVLYDRSYQDHSSASGPSKQKRNRRKRSNRGAKNNRNINKSFGGYKQCGNESSGQQNRQELPAQLLEKVTVVDKQPINVHQIVPTEEVPTEQMKELVINPKPKKSSRSRRKKKNRANKFNATMPEPEKDVTTNRSINMNQTIGCISSTGILKKTNDDYPKRSKSVVFGSPSTPRALWSAERNRHSSGLGLRHWATQNGNDSICAASMIVEEKCPPSWKYSAVIHISEVIQSKSNARFIGLYLAHRGVVTPMPDIIVKNGKVIFVEPNSTVLKKMPSNFLFNLYPSEHHKRGQLLTGRYYYSANFQNMSALKTYPNKFTISNLPDHLMDVNMYNPDVKSKEHMEVVLAEFITKKPLQEAALKQSILEKSGIQKTQEEAEKEPVLETTSPAEPLLSTEATGDSDNLPFLATTPVCRPRQKSMPKPPILEPTADAQTPTPLLEPTVESHVPIPTPTPILEPTAEVHAPIVREKPARRAMLLPPQVKKGNTETGRARKPIGPTAEVQAPMLLLEPTFEVQVPIPTPTPILEPAAEVQAPMVPEKPGRRPMLLPPQAKKGNTEVGRARKPIGPLNKWTPEKEDADQNKSCKTDAKTPAKDLQTVANAVKVADIVVAPVNSKTPSQNAKSSAQKKKKTPGKGTVADPNYVTPSSKSGKKRPVNFTPLNTSTPRRSRRPESSDSSSNRREQQNPEVPLPLNLDMDESMDSSRRTTPSPITK